MGFRIIWPHDQSISSGSAVLSGAKFHAYENNTTTPVTLYSDRACTTTRANPVVASSDGRFEVAYVPSGDLLSLALNTSADVEIDSWDDIEPAATISGVLLAANNLDDLDDAPTALYNLGAGELASISFADLSLLSVPDPFTDYVFVYDASAGEWKKLGLPEVRPLLPYTVAVGDETTAITTGTAKITFRAPWAMALTEVRASLGTASSSGIVTVDINAGGVSVLSTKLTIDANEKTSTTAATAAVISNPLIGDDSEITIDIDSAGTSAAGLKVTLIAFHIL